MDCFGNVIFSLILILDNHCLIWTYYDLKYGSSDTDVVSVIFLRTTA